MIVFLFAAFLLSYIYAGYPLVLLFLSRKSKTQPAPPPVIQPPFLSLLIPVYNEEKAIAAKVENALGLDYPRERYEVVVVSDGSSDGTVRIVESFLSRGVRLIDLHEHRGKMAALNHALPSLKGEIVVFTDVTAIFEIQALRLLANAFADPKVGAASGELILKEESTPGAEIRVDYYWRLEKFIRRSEGSISSCAGATGAIYAIRRGLYRPLPEDSLLDDLLLPLEVVRRGYRVVFVEQARAHEDKFTDLHMEFRRKVRTLAGNYQTFRREWWSLVPGRSPIAFFLISHKLLRLVSPFLLLLLLGSSAAGAGALKVFFAIQLIFYLTAAWGWFEIRTGRKKSKIAAAPLAFVLLNAAALKAFVVACLLRRLPSW